MPVAHISAISVGLLYIPVGLYKTTRVKGCRHGNEPGSKGRLIDLEIMRVLAAYHYVNHHNLALALSIRLHPGYRKTS